jgi:polar amino acid transport system substrate-binding protein
MGLTLSPETLVVASAYPDPPFDLIEDGSATGFDIELMRAICAQLRLALQPVRYSGDDFNGIFDGLAKGSCDAVVSGTTITPERAAVALFSQPYLEFNQGVAVNRRSTPKVSSLGDLRGQTAGIQSDTVALEDDWTPAEAVGPPAFASVGGFVVTENAAVSGGVESIRLDGLKRARTPPRN